jgi:hypothetical protein
MPDRRRKSFMNHMKNKSDGKDMFDGKRLQFVGWFEDAPFTVEVNGRFGPAN